MKKFFAAVFLVVLTSVILKNFPMDLSFAYVPTSSKSQVISGNYIPKQNFNSSQIPENLNFSENSSELTNYSLPSVITTQEQWREAINYCTDNLIDEVSFTIEDFTEDKYNLKTLDFVNTSVQAKGSVKNNNAIITYTFNYKENYLLNKAAKDSKYLSKLTKDQLALFNQIKEISNSIIKPGMSDFEKEKAIHDYIVLNSAYSTSITDSSYTIRNLIKNKTGVCEAYAYAFQLFCTFSGIECEIITGTLNKENHGWNLVKLDGEYYHVDVTSDDPVPNKEGQVLYPYFNLTDAEMSKTHKWNVSDFPSCTATKYNYYIYNNLVAENPEQLRSIVLSELQKGKKEIHFYVKNFVIKDTSDFDFCSESKNPISSFYIIGKIGSDGAFMLRPTYSD